MSVEPDNKMKYIKLAKNTVIASILITLSLSLLEIPKSYFGTPVGIADEGTSDITFAKIEDKDCQNREVVNIDGKRYVITDSNKTIASYLKYLEESFLIEKSKRFDVKGKKYIETPSKYYFVDIGIRNSLINFRQIEKTHIMENIIYTELRRRGFNVDVGIVEKRKIDEKGKKDYRQLEVDFVANKGSDKYYIQSAYSIEDNNKKEQELQSLLNISDNFKKMVIVYDSFIKWQDDNGIIYISIYDFLLNENSLKEA